MLPRYDERRGMWIGGDTRTLFTFTGKVTGAVGVYPGGGSRGKLLMNWGPEATVRLATRAEAEEHWQKPLHAGWKVANGEPAHATRKTSKKASEKIGRTMREFKRGTLKSGSGGKVTSREQAIAIALSQARAKGYKVPPAPVHARKKSPAQLEREIAEALAKKPADQWTVHDRLAVMTPSQKKRELKDLQAARENYLRALGYAGNTPDQVRKYHDAIEEIDAKMRLFSSAGSTHARRRSHSTKATSNGLFAVEIDRATFESTRDLPTGAHWRPNQAKLAEDELAHGRSYRRPKDARYAVIEWTGYRSEVGRLLDWLERAEGITRYAEIFA